MTTKIVPRATIYPVTKKVINTQHGALSNKTQHRETNFYNLNAIISVSYRGNYHKTTNFRIRTTQILKEYMQKASWHGSREMGKILTNNSPKKI